MTWPNFDGPAPKSIQTKKGTVNSLHCGLGVPFLKTSPKSMDKTADLFAKQDGMPDWLDPEIWQDFQQHRKEIRAKLTPTATHRMLQHLEKYRALGVDPNEALELSIRNQWRGVFPERLVGGDEKSNGNGQRTVHETAATKRDREVREEYEATLHHG